MTMIVLNVGGAYFFTYRSTLEGSLSTFFHGMLQSQPNTTSEFFIDRDPTHFRYILNWLRGVRYLPHDEATIQELRWETNFFCMDDMHEALGNIVPVPSIHRSLNRVACS